MTETMEIEEDDNYQEYISVEKRRERAAKEILQRKNKDSSKVEDESAQTQTQPEEAKPSLLVKLHN